MAPQPLFRAAPRKLCHLQIEPSVRTTWMPYAFPRGTHAARPAAASNPRGAPAAGEPRRPLAGRGACPSHIYARCTGGGRPREAPFQRAIACGGRDGAAAATAKRPGGAAGSGVPRAAATTAASRGPSLGAGCPVNAWISIAARRESTLPLTRERGVREGGRADELKRIMMRRITVGRREG